MCLTDVLIYIYIYTHTHTGVLISPQPDQEGNKLGSRSVYIYIYNVCVCTCINHPSDQPEIIFAPELTVFLIKPSNYEGKARSHGTYFKPKIKQGAADRTPVFVARRFLPTGPRVQVQVSPWTICGGHSDKGAEFWGAFATFRKATGSFVISVRPHRQLGSQCRIFTEFNI